MTLTNVPERDEANVRIWLASWVLAIHETGVDAHKMQVRP